MIQQQILDKLKDSGKPNLGQLFGGIGGALLGGLFTPFSAASTLGNVMLGGGIGSSLFGGGGGMNLAPLLGDSLMSRSTAPQLSRTGTIGSLGSFGNINPDAFNFGAGLTSGLDLLNAGMNFKSDPFTGTLSLPSRTTRNQTRRF